MEFFALLGEFVHKELRVTLVNCENMRGGDWNEAVLWNIHDWMAKFMRDIPVQGTLCKGAASPWADPRWYLAFR